MISRQFRTRNITFNFCGWFSLLQHASIRRKSSTKSLQNSDRPKVKMNDSAAAAMPIAGARATLGRSSCSAACRSLSPCRSRQTSSSRHVPSTVAAAAAPPLLLPSAVGGGAECVEFVRFSRVVDGCFTLVEQRRGEFLLLLDWRSLRPNRLRQRCDDRPSLRWQ